MLSQSYLVRVLKGEQPKMVGISHMHPRAKRSKCGKVLDAGSSWIAVGGKPAGGVANLSRPIGQRLVINVGTVNASRANQWPNPRLSALEDADSLSGEGGKRKQNRISHSAARLKQ